MNVTFIASPNYTAGKKRSINYIVDHWTWGTADAAVSRFLRAGSNQPGGPASAHLIIARDGRKIQMVDFKDVAWHSGNAKYNYEGVGIEHEHWGYDQDWPEAQIQSSAEAHAELSQTYGIPLVRPDGVLGHNETGTPTQCPGSLPIDRIISIARGEEEELTPEQLKALILAPGGYGEALQGQLESMTKRLDQLETDLTVVGTVTTAPAHTHTATVTIK